MGSALPRGRRSRGWSWRTGDEQGNNGISALAGRGHVFMQVHNVKPAIQPGAHASATDLLQGTVQLLVLQSCRVGQEGSSLFIVSKSAPSERPTQVILK